MVVVKILKVIFILVLILCLGCNTSRKNRTKIVVKGQVDKLEKIVHNNLNNESELNPEIVLNSIVELYLSDKNIIVGSNENPIDIYVTYGTDFWRENNKNKTFEISIAHQKVGENDGILYEYRIDMIYKPTEFKGITGFNLGYNPTSDLGQFKKSIKESDGFKKALKIKPIRVEIIKERI